MTEETLPLPRVTSADEWRRDLAELAHVLVAAVAGGGDDADAGRPGEVVG